MDDQPITVAKALEGFLEPLKPSGADAVRVALLRRLAVMADHAPAYVLPRLTAALEEILAALGAEHERELSESRVERLLAPLEGL